MALLLLSEDLQEDLIRSKPMCKRWTAIINTFINNEAFIYKHLDHSSKTFIRTVDTVIVIDPLTKKRSTLPLPQEFLEPNEIDTLLHCDGLMLCRRRDGGVKSFEPEEESRPQIAIWNPLLREVRWIQGSLALHTLFGVGYKARSEGYKILSFPNIRFNWVHDGDENSVKIYDLENHSWRILDHVKVDWLVDSSCNGVAVLGNMYWLPEKKKNKKHKSYILGFDFTVENFKEDVCLCPPSLGDRYLSCYSNDRLSLLQQERKSRKIEVWVSNKLSDESVSFTRCFKVDSSDVPALKPREHMSCPAYYVVKPRSIAAWCEGVEEDDPYCTLYKIDENGLRTKTEMEQISEKDWQPICCGHVYVPTLVPVP